MLSCQEEVNVRIVNGKGSTASTNSVGNLIVGYNETGENANDTYEDL